MCRTSWSHCNSHMMLQRIAGHDSHITMTLLPQYMCHSTDLTSLSLRSCAAMADADYVEIMEEEAAFDPYQEVEDAEEECFFDVGM